jgi:outer membrane protein insertion porin family
MISVLQRCVFIILIGLSVAWPTTFSGGAAWAKSPRVLKFSGVPMSMGAGLKKQFPFVFEREVSLAEVDDIVRYLMKAGSFSNIEVVERTGTSGEREMVLLASLLRKIHEVRISGNQAIPDLDVQHILNVVKDQAFERKNLLNSAEELRKAYEHLGYHNAKVEIDFEVPSENEVTIIVNVTEGQPVRISEVAVETPNTELASKLMRLRKSLVGKILTEDELTEFQKSVATILQDNHFLTARLGSSMITFNTERTTAKVNYPLENPYRFEFHIEGNDYLSEGTLLRIVQEERLAGAVSSPAPDMAEKIRRYYQSLGFANVEVAAEEKLSEADFRELIRFKIKEGPRVRLKKIEVNGNISRPESYYAAFIKSSSSDLIGSGFYNRKDIEDGTKKLITELQNQGYLRAKVQSQRAEYSKDKASITLYLTVDEGPLTQIRQIRLEGVDSFPKPQILEMLKVKSGAALSLKDLEDSLQIIKTFYRSEGFLEMKILNENEQNKIVTYNETNTQATVEFQIYEGPRVIVGSIITSGNTFTKSNVILREVAFKIGDVLTPEKIEETLFRLQKLGLFAQVNIRTIEDGTNIAERNVLIEVDERDPGLVKFGFGVNNDWTLTIRGYGSIAYRNLLGTGRALSLRVDPRYVTQPNIDYLEHTITVSYLEPYIFGGQTRGRVNVSSEESFFNFDATNVNAIIQENNTVGFLLERDLTRHLKLTYNVYSFSNITKFVKQTNVTVQTQNIGKTGPLLELDFRDDVFNPSKGTYSILNLEYSDPVMGSSDDATQNIKFFKANAQTTVYQRIAGKKDLVWANSVRGGYLTNLSYWGNSGIPAQEAFFLGGRTTIRGFDPSNQEERIPNNYALGVTDLTQFYVNCDTYFYLIKTELRFPIWGRVGGAIFYDGGAVVINQPSVVDPNPYRDAVGVGLRIGTPVGPLNLEIAWKLQRRVLLTYADGTQRIEAPYQFYVSLGAF